MPKTVDMEAITGRLQGAPAATTATRVVQALRELLIEGSIPPGTRLSEEQFAIALKVSRNTLREAFRLLAHQGLLVHEVNRGVFVRQLSRDELADLYEARRLVQMSALLSPAQHTPARIAKVKLALAEGEVASAADDGRALGTANMRFHAALAALAGNRRLDEIAAGLLAELRIAFHVIPDVDRFHREFWADNVRIGELVEAGETGAAVAALNDYTTRSLAQILESFDGIEGSGT